MNTIVELFENNLNNNKVLFQEDGTDKLKWFRYSSNELKQIALTYISHIDETKFVDSNRVVVIYGDNTVNDFCKILACWYIGAVPVHITNSWGNGYKKIILDDLAIGYNHVIWETLYNVNFKNKNTNLKNTWQSINSNTSLFLILNYKNVKLLKFTIEAYKNVMMYAYPDDIVDNDEIFIGLFDWGLYDRVIISMLTSSRLYLTSDKFGTLWKVETDKKAKSIVDFFSKLKCRMFRGCDNTLTALKDIADKKILENPSISQTALKEFVFSKNIEKVVCAIHKGNIEKADELVTYFKTKMNIDICYQIYMAETPYCFRTTQNDYQQKKMKPFSTDINKIDFYTDTNKDLFIKSNISCIGYIDPNMQIEKDSNNYIKTPFIATKDTNGYITLTQKKTLN
jgi:hypothetical protein